MHDPNSKERPGQKHYKSLGIWTMQDKIGSSEQSCQEAEENTQNTGEENFRAAAPDGLGGGDAQPIGRALVSALEDSPENWRDMEWVAA